MVLYNKRNSTLKKQIKKEIIFVIQLQVNAEKHLAKRSPFCPKEYTTYLLVCFSKEIVKHFDSSYWGRKPTPCFETTFKTSRKYWKLPAFTEAAVS